MTTLRDLYHEFPSRFWIVVGVHFIDKIGGTLVFPFFALYITGKFNVGMTEAISASGFYALHLKLGAEPKFASAATRSERAPLAREAEHG